MLHLCAIKKDHLSVYCLGNVIKYERGSREQTVGLHAQFTILANMLGQCVDRDMNCVRYIILNHNDVPTLPFHTSPLLKKHEHPPSEKKKKKKQTNTHTKKFARPMTSPCTSGTEPTGPPPVRPSAVIDMGGSQGPRWGVPFLVALVGLFDLPFCCVFLKLSESGSCESCGICVVLSFS